MDKKWISPRKLLADPSFHALPEEVRRTILSDMWPEFASGDPGSQRLTLETSAEQWNSIFNPPPPPPKSMWEKTKDFLAAPPEKSKGAASLWGEGLVGTGKPGHATMQTIPPLEPPPGVPGLSVPPAGTGVSEQAMNVLGQPPSTDQEEPGWLGSMFNLMGGTYARSLTSNIAGTLAAAWTAGKSAIRSQRRFAEEKAKLEDIRRNYGPNVYLKALEDYAKKEKEWQKETEGPRMKAEYETSFLYNWSKEMDNRVNEIFPVNPKFAQGFMATLSSGLGSMLAFASGGVALKALKAPALLGSSGLGALTQVKDPWEKALEDGASSTDLYKVLIANSALGATEGIPIERALAKLDHFTGGWVGKWIKDYARRVTTGEGIKSGIEEMLQEFVQQFGTNLTAKLTHDPDQPLWDGVLESTLAGGILGGAMGGVMTRLNVARGRERAKQIGLSKEDIAALEATADKYENDYDQMIRKWVQPDRQPVLLLGTSLGTPAIGAGPGVPLLGPAPGTELPGGGIMGGGVSVGEEGGIPTRGERTITPVGEGGIPAPPATRITEEKVKYPGLPEENLRPVTKEEFERMQARVDLIKNNPQAIKDPIMGSPEMQKAVKLGLDRLDWYELRRLRERMGIPTRMPEPPPPPVGAPGAPETAKPGIERLRMAQAGLEVPPSGLEGPALFAPPTIEQKQKAGIKPVQGSLFGEPTVDEEGNLSYPSMVSEGFERANKAVSETLMGAVPSPETGERAGAPIKKVIKISTKPGGMGAAEVTLEELVDRHRKIISELGVTPENPRISLIEELGIPHTVTQPLGFGTWEGAEPNIHIEFPSTVPYAQVRQVAAFMGEGWGQDAVAVSHPDSNVDTFVGLQARKADGSEFTLEEIDLLAKNSKVGFETDATNRVLIFNKYWPGQDTFLDDTIEALNVVGIGEEGLTYYTGDSHLVERSEGHYSAAIREARDQARASGRPDIPERILRQFRTAFAAGHPEAAARVAERRAKDVAAEVDQRALHGTPGSGEMGTVSGGYGVIIANRPSGARASEGGGIPGPPGWRGLEGAVRRGDIRPTVLAGQTPAPGGGGPGNLEADLASLDSRGKASAPGQTRVGRNIAKLLLESPSIDIEGRPIRILNTDGIFSRDFLERILLDPAVIKLVTLQKQLADRVKQFLLDAYPNADFARATYAGEQIRVNVTGLNSDGNRIFGDGGTCPIFTNSMEQVSYVNAMVARGKITPEEAPSLLAWQMVNTIHHEFMHQQFKADNSEYRQLLNKIGHQNRVFIDEQEEILSKELAESGLMRDLKEVFEVYANTTSVVDKVFGERMWMIEDHSPAFRQKATEIALELYKKTPKGLEPPAEAKIKRKRAEKVGEEVVRTLEDTSAMVDLVASQIIKIGRVGGATEGYKRFEELPTFKQYPIKMRSKSNFDRIFKAATIKAAADVPGLLQEERDSLSALDLARINQFTDELLPKLDEIEALSKMGKITRGWYRRANELCTWLSHHLPGPPGMSSSVKRNKLVRLIAATSPQQGVKDNFLMALKLWRYWADPQQAAREVPDLQLDPNIKPFDTDPERLQTLITSSEPEWEVLPSGKKRYVYERDENGKLIKKINAETGLPEKVVVYKRKGTVDLDARLNNSITALTGYKKQGIFENQEFDGKKKRVRVGWEWVPGNELDLSGFKVTSFARNILGLLKYMTLDTHMANITNIPQRLVGKKAAYLAMSGVFRRAAENLKYEPAEQQETSWTAIRALFLLNRKGVPFDEAFRKITPDLLMELSANTELVTMLLEDEDVKSELDKLGLTDTIRKASRRLQKITAVGRDLSAAEEIDPDVAARIIANAEYVKSRRATELAEENERRGIAPDAPEDVVVPESDLAAGEGEGDIEFDVSEFEGPPVELHSTVTGLEPPPRFKKRLPKSISASSLGIPRSNFDFDGGWIMPDGTPVSFVDTHFNSLAKALKIHPRLAVKYMKRLANKYGLIRVRTKGRPWDPRPGVEVFGIPTAAQMAAIGQMQREMKTNVVYNVTDSDTGEIKAYGGGLLELRRSIDEQFGNVELEARVTPLPTPPSRTPQLDRAERVFTKRATPGAWERLKAITTKVIPEIEKRFIGEFAPARELEAKVRRAAQLPQKKDYRMGLDAMTEAIYQAPSKAQRDLIDFEEILQPVKNNLHDFNLFLFFKRIQDRLAYDPTKRRVADYTMQDAVDGLRELEGKVGAATMDKFRRVGDRTTDAQGNLVPGPYQKIMDRALKLQVSSGRISQEMYDVIKDMNDFYAPFAVLQYLQGEEEGSQGMGKSIATKEQLSYAIKGIDDVDFRLANIIQSSADVIYKSRILAEKNKIMLVYDQFADLDPSGAFIKKFKGPRYQAPTPGSSKPGGWVLPDGTKPPPDKAILPYLKDGIGYGILTDKEVVMALQGMNVAQTKGVLLSTMRFFGSALRAGATTMNLAFQPVNYLFADLPRLALVSRYGIQNPMDLFKFVADFLGGTVSAARGSFGNADYYYKLALELGVLNSTIQKNLTPQLLAKKYELNENEPGLKRLLSKSHNVTLGTFAKLANALEEASKVAGLRRALRIENINNLTGQARIEAMQRMVTELRRYAGSPDFARAGSDGRLANLLFMFINARIQGTHADFVRLLGHAGKKDAAAAWVRLGAITLPMLLAAIMNYLPENKEDYELLPGWEKENYWMIPRPSYYTDDSGKRVREYWRVPKREIFKLMGNTIDTFVGFMAGHEPEAATKLATSFLENISPVNIEGDTLLERMEAAVSGMNPIIKAPAEQLFNRDTFRHRPIISRSLEDLPPERQYRKNTPAIYRAAGQALGASPLRVEQAIGALTAGMFTQFMMKKPTGDREWWTEAPVVKRFVRSTWVENEDETQRLYQAVMEQATDRAIQRQVSENIYEARIKGEDAKTAARVIAEVTKKDRLLGGTLKRIVADAKLGLTYQDRQIKSLGIASGDRAAYIRGALDRLPNEQARQAWRADLRKKKILTADVEKQMKANVTPIRRANLPAPPQ